jgi:hypothetical protein
MRRGSHPARALTRRIKLRRRSPIQAWVKFASLPTYATVFAQRRGDGTACPGGQTLVSVAEAAAHRDAVCAKLGSWDIVRLAGGGSMDGPGYHCGTRDHDDRSLGGVLCKPGARPAGSAR